MSTGWRDRLKAIRERLFGGAPQGWPAAEAAETRSASEPLDRTASHTIPRADAPVATAAINFGIDFGTSYTKICYRDLGAEESGVVIGGANFKDPLIPSVVAIGDQGRLYLGDELPASNAAVLLTYLKMRLARSPIGGKLPSIAGVDLNEEHVIRSLAAWFLASVIARAQAWMTRHEADRLKNRTPVWSANIGVPVEHCDSDALPVFQEVLGVAWLWIRDGKMPATLQQALETYGACAERLAAEVTDFHVVPEIAAAVQSFVMSREAVPGIYVYFDIGGGTVDGVAFNYVNYDGERRINFYSGKVESIGISALAARIRAGEPGNIDARQLESLLQECPRETLDALVYGLQQLVAQVIMTAKKKDNRDWQEDAIQSEDYERKFIGRLSPSRMRPLIVFIGGGGSKSHWYKTSISRTYSDFNHHNAGIPPYKLLEVPKPKDFSMKHGVNGEFIRFAISYGLSIPYGEGPEIRLPSKFFERESPAPQHPSGAISYLDSKDVYD